MRKRRTTKNAKSSGSRPVSRQFQIRPEGWCYLAVLSVLFLGALIRDINLLMLLFGMLAGPLVYSLWYGWFALRHLEVRRQLPERVHAGEPFDVTIELTNRRRWFGVWAIMVHDSIRRADGQSAPRDSGTLFLYLGAGKSHKLTYQAQLFDRGTYRFGPLSVSTRFPLGLFRRWLTFEQVDSLLVWPRLGTLTRPTRSGADLADQVSKQMDRQRGYVEGDFYGLRDWRSGDTRRWIHWPTSARMGELMVRQFERHQAPELAVIVDLWQPPRPTREDLENTELAISFAGTLVADACRRGGNQVTLAVAAQPDSLTRGAASPASFRHMLDELAVANPASDDHLLDLCLRLWSATRAGARTVLVTTRAVDLTREIGLPEGLRDPRAMHWLRQIVVVEAQSPEFETYFQPL